jgi:membrane protease YdiL (CAAX protease family)
MAAWLLVTVWCLLLVGGLAAPRLGSARALVACYAACTALLLAAQARPRSPFALAGAGLAAAAGFVALPAWLVSMWVVGLLLGLPPVPRASAVAASASAWLAHVALAPVFEELLYRERLLPALRARIGAPLALVLSSALFAAPHLEPWSVLTTFAVGLALGGVFLATGRIELCVAHHAGLNAAVLVCGLPPIQVALAPPLAALVGVRCSGSRAWTRRRTARTIVHALACAPRASRPHQA